MLIFLSKHFWKSFLTRTFWLEDETGQRVAEIKTRTLTGVPVAFAAGGVKYVVSQRQFRGPLILEHDGVEVARADGRDYGREYAIIRSGAEYALKQSSGRKCTLSLGSHEIGSVAPLWWFSRRARVDLPDDMDIASKAFVAWLALLLREGG